MFTGLVETLGTVTFAKPEPPGLRLGIEAGTFAAEARIGESICVSGCCLSVVAAGDTTVEFDAGPETLSRTTLGRLTSGAKVNLERAMRLSDRLGGHLVTGHVDGIGELVDRRQEGEWVTCRFRVPPGLEPHLVPKGSIAVDGVSLTLCDVAADSFTVALIPHTLAMTTLGPLAAGGAVNLETDLLAKLVERQVKLLVKGSP
jgi:riboflavin synthase